MLSLAAANTKEVIVLGNLNASYFKRDDNSEIKRIILVNGFKQIIKKATRTTLNTSTLIDVIITNNPSAIAGKEVVPMAFPDHDLIGCVRKLNHIKYAKQKITVRN